MVRINFEKSKEFLEKINEKDSVTIFCHTDLDGLASGVLFYDFCISKNCNEVKIFPLDYGIDKISDYNLERTTKILIADLGPEFVSEELSKISKFFEIFYTDHHPENKNFPIPKEVLEFRTTEEGYIPSSRTVYELCGGKKWLAVLGVISDFGDAYDSNDKFLEDYIQEIDRSLEYLKKELMYKLSRVIIFFEKHKESRFIDILKEVKYLEDLSELNRFEKPVKEEFEKQVEIFEEKVEKLGDINFFKLEQEYNIKSFLINYLSQKETEKVLIVVTPLENRLWKISGRNQSKEYDVPGILNKAIEGIPNSSAGGHKSAAGGNIPFEYLNKFKKNLSEIKLENYRI